jgi:ubiquinol-cytochrome c reductase cytochrome c subunit
MTRTLLVLAVMIGVAPAAWADDAAGDAQHGEKLFAADGCYQCHGYVGQGSIRTGPALAPAVIPMSAFTAQLRKPMDKMPAYTEVVLSSGDIADIYAYLKSLPKPPNPADVALLQN